MHGQLSVKRMQNRTVDRPVTPADPVPGGLVSDFTRMIIDGTASVPQRRAAVQ